MIPEAAYAMLACARIGAVHSIVFGGFSPDSLADRMNGCDLQGGHHRRRRPARRPQGAAESQCRQGARKCAGRRHVIVVKRTGGDVAMHDGRDVWYHEASQGKSAGLRASRKR
jgi:acetyl-CoA synthetase